MGASLRAIDIFVAAVEMKSFASAARTLLIDPSAVSRAIKALEDELGVVLFARSTRTLTLTDEGYLFYRDCVHIVDKLKEATERFRGRSELPQGRLKIGMGPALTKRMLLRVLPRFLKEHTNVEVVLFNVGDVADFAKKGVDVFIKGHSVRQRGGEHPELQGLVERRLCRAQYVACASQEYLKIAGPLRKPADLLKHQCIVQLTSQHDVLDQWHFQSLKSRESEKVKIIPRLLAQGNDAMREAAVAGCGIIRAAAHHIGDELRSGALQPILPEWECVGAPFIVAIYRKTRQIRPQVRAFVQFLAETLRHRE